MQSFYRVVFTLAFAILATSVEAEDRLSQKSIPSVSERAFCKHVLQGELFARTELFFGLSKPGGVVTEIEFQTFIDNEVTPRFPEGLTLLSGIGQFQDQSRAIIREGSKLLILLYPFSRERSTAIEAIRSAYKKDFQQQSVLRVDEQSCVSF